MTARERQVFEKLLGACEAIGRDWEHNLSHAAQLCRAAAAEARPLLVAGRTRKPAAKTPGQRKG